MAMVDDTSSFDPFATSPAPVDNTLLNQAGLSTTDPTTGNVGGGAATGNNPSGSMNFDPSNLTNLANMLAQYWGINKSANAMTRGLNQAAGAIQQGTGQGVNAVQQGTQQGVNAVTGALAPWAQGGGAAGSQFLANLGIPGYGQASDITKVPGFEKQLAAITGALGNSASARGMGLSTNALAGMADATGQLSRNTWDDLQQQLFGAARVGEGAASQQASQLAGLYGSQGTNLANLYGGQGAALADLFTQRGQVQGTQAAAQANAAGGGGGGGIGGILKDVGGIVGAISSIGSLFSDRDLKVNIKPKGIYKGHQWYEFDYIWGEHSEGVMADEVMETNPAAVSVHPAGFLMVDYRRL